MQNLFDRKPLGEEKKKNKGGNTFLILSGIIIFFIVIFYYNYSDFKKDNLTKTSQIITIKSGENFNDLAKKIDGINSFWLNFYLKFNKPNFELQVGRYKIEENSDIEEIINSLKEAIPDTEVYIKILEGRNIYDIDACLSNPQKFLEETNIICVYTYNENNEKKIYGPLIETGEYINYVTNPEKIEQISKFFPFIKNLESLEGFLYPDTYTLGLNNFEIRKLVVDKQLSAFEEKVYNKLLKNISNENIIDLIKLSSIVEKEERNPDEKAIVAGILKKRLNSNWMIGADITVCYPHELTSEQCKMVVSKYIDEKSEYNTRTMLGLPKTPIGNPSFETIEATLNSKETAYWFYLHNVKTGKVYYAETNAQHEANKKYMY